MKRTAERARSIGRGVRGMLAMSAPAPVDSTLVAATIALLGFGVVMVYSASSYEATVRLGDAQFYVKRQAIYVALALGVMWLASRFDYRKLRPFTYFILGGVMLAMAATVFGFGHRAGNAYRWLKVGPVHIQPSEMAKVALVLWLAYSLSKKADKIRTFWVGFVPHMITVGALTVLCLMQPDFGSAVVLTMITFALMFVAGGRLSYILASVSLAVGAAILLVRLSPYRMARWMAFSNMDEHRQSLAYQPFQSVMSFGSGGFGGLGLGRGYQVLYLPEAHTDFIAAIVGEELGFVGIALLLATFGVVVWRGVAIALAAADDYGTYIAFGLSTLLGTQVLLNLSVALAIVPTKGLTLPFLSYGGSSLLVSAASIGLLLNVSRHAHRAPDPISAPPAAAAESASMLVATAAEDGA